MHPRTFRQQAGYACETCRRRKARCDRLRPQCSLCTEMGVPCIVVDQRPQRGPKKGQLEEMRARIAQLEWQLGKQPDSVMSAELMALDTADALRDTGSSGTGNGAGAGSGCSTPPIAPPPLDEPTVHTSSSQSLQPLQTVKPVTYGSSTVAAGIFPTAATAVPAMPVLPPTEHGGGFSALLDWQDMDMSGVVMMEPDIPDTLQFVDPEPAGRGPVRTLAGGLKITSPVLADLDQLYFDRVHNVLPMLHRRRYFSWADQEKPTATLGQRCLQSAMHTLAAAMSAQYQSLGDALYQDTCQLLESQRSPTPSRSGSGTSPETSWLARTTAAPIKSSRAESGGGAGGISNIPIEVIQAWILLAHYEFLRVEEHQAMVTAGRAFRLVQLARLYDVDGSNPADESQPESTSAPDPDSDSAFIIAEEKRRTFWLAFSLDRFLCSRSELPLTLHEETVRTHLPAPEAAFQNNQPTTGCCLAQALDAPTRDVPFQLSPFAECIVLVALLGRCLTHRRMALHNAHETPTRAQRQELWLQHEHLASAIEERTEILAQSHALNQGAGHDPMILSTHMLAQQVVIYLSDTLEMASRQQEQQQQQQPQQLKPQEHQTVARTRQPLPSSYRYRAEVAAAETVRLAESVRLLGCFGLHPFMADHLAGAADFLIRHAMRPTDTNEVRKARSNSGSSTGRSSYGGASGSGSGGVESLLSVLRNLCYVNNHAQDLLCALEASYGVRCSG
ncbi:hypothetical protein BDW74DRAFT_17032 [Aspergillus multicolor]|uniref:uncharacterized protein n=1 Tax=Aspergillus multicolor TaxID=41759 RepID=UPI003CCDABFF